MSVVKVVTRDEWECSGGWRSVETYVNGVVMLFREEDDPTQDVQPCIVRKNHAGDVHPDDSTPLPDVPYRYYERDDEHADTWHLMDEGEAYPNAHKTIIIAWNRWSETTE